MKSSQWAAVMVAFLTQGHAFADGGMSTGGGGAVVCRDGNKKVVSAELLDLYEGKVRFGFDIAYDTANPKDQIRLALARIKDEFRQAKASEVVADVIHRFQFLPPGVVLHPGADLGDNYGVVIPDGCALESVGFYEEDGTLKVAQPIYWVLSSTDKAAFIVHEALYKIARDTSSASSSASTRTLVAAIFSKNATPEKIAQLNEQIFFTTQSSRNDSFAMLQSPSAGVFNIRLNPLGTKDYFFGIQCLNLSGQEIGKAAYFEGTGATTLILEDKKCSRLSISTSGRQGKHPTIEFDLSAGSTVFFSDTNTSYRQKVINLGRYVETPDFPHVQ